MLCSQRFLISQFRHFSFDEATIALDKITEKYSNKKPLSALLIDKAP